jgi:hypothetical protein
MGSLTNIMIGRDRTRLCVCITAHTLLGVALPDLLLLTPLTWEHAELLKPVERVTEADPEFESVYTQLKADFQNQFGAE